MMELWCCRRPSSSSPVARFRRSVVLLCVALTVCGVVYLGYFCPERVCALSSTSVVVVLVSNNNNRNYNDHNNISGGGGGQRSAASMVAEKERPLGAGQANDVDPLEDVDERRDDLRVFVAGGQYNERRRTAGGRHASSSRSRAGRTVSVSYDEITNSSMSPSVNAMLFDIRGADVIVFLHIQKTGGTTFGRHLVHDLDLEKPCVCTSGTSSSNNNNNNGGGSAAGLGRRGRVNGRQQQQQQLIQQQQRKRCRCVRPNSDTSCWLFSRFSTGWQCGLHADWTELNDCVDSALDREEHTASSIKATPVGAAAEDDDGADDDDDEYAAVVAAAVAPSPVGRSRPRRRYFYVTLLRDPLVRFISEFLHVQRGATWKTARHFCDGRPASRRELPSCYEGYDDWEGVSLDEFMSCPSNLAINRQTRMLADLSLVNCYNMTSMSARRRDAIMLASAKENLRRLAFFGLCEQQQVAQYMFEETFRVNFLTTFQQLNETHVTSAFAGDVTVEQMRRAKQLNYLDVQLYEYARNLLAERFDAMRRADPHFDAHYRGLRPARPPTKYLPWEVEASDSN